MLTSVSHSHSYSVSDIHILFIIPPLLCLQLLFREPFKGLKSLFSKA